MIPESIRSSVEQWMAYDDATRRAIEHLVAENPQELQEAFCDNLAFGTGGMRGLMGVGPNRINPHTVRQATVGLARHLRQQHPQRELRVAVAYDTRHQSESLARTAAEVLTAHGVRVYLYHGPRPTPQLSYTVRALHCQAGIVITASHNPKEYNGYKVYGQDGGQIVAPEDAQIMEHVARCRREDAPLPPADPSLITPIDGQLDEAYINALLSTLRRPEAVAAHPALPVVYTPIHGAGASMLPALLRRAGFTGVHTLAAQQSPDGAFPTVQSPNPEEPTAMALACQKAEELGATLVLGTDPDADRLGAYVRNAQGQLQRLDGNQIAVLLAHYLLQSQPPSDGSPAYIVRTIVTTPMLDLLAADHGLPTLRVLTGFKYIASVMAREQRQHPTRRFLFGAEESHGYLATTEVRDKDALQSAMLLCEMAAHHHARGENLMDVLHGLYARHGAFVSALRSITLTGSQGQREVQRRMRQLREKPPASLGGEALIARYDYASGLCARADGTQEKIDLPPSDVLQFQTEHATITVRPSGTEPKMKYYISLRGPYTGHEGLAALQRSAERLLEDFAQRDAP
ncbi:MAG: phosphoglucomutase [Bacteroidia bacterium]|nr:MAG: phosphoglucomutase [Bacteroidia bacterium]